MLISYAVVAEMATGCGAKGLVLEEELELDMAAGEGRRRTGSGSSGEGPKVV